MPNLHDSVTLCRPCDIYVATITITECPICHEAMCPTCKEHEHRDVNDARFPRKEAEHAC